MLLFVLLTVGLVAGVFGDHEHDAHRIAAHCCSTEDRHETQKIWRNVWGAQYSGHRVAVAQAVFLDLFEHHPETQALFERVDGNNVESPKFKAHCVRVVGGFDLAVNLLNNPEVLNEQLNHLSDQHIERKGVKREYFKYIGESFMRVMPQAVGCFNSDAWRRCFGRIAYGIAHELPTES